MNFLAHGIAFLDNPYFVAGTSAPDWLSVADRPVRIRARFINQFLEKNPDPAGDAISWDSPEVSFACGARQHLEDDDWFHRQRSFVEISTQLSRMFRETLGPDDNFRAGFLGHIVTEMLLDRVLMEQTPELLDRYYRAIESVNFLTVQRAVGEIATRPTDRLAQLLPRFVDEAFLYDYRSEKKLLFRLNQVMRRVRLPLLVDEFEDVLADATLIVEHHHRELLPQHVLEVVDRHSS